MFLFVRRSVLALALAVAGFCGSHALAQSTPEADAKPATPLQSSGQDVKSSEPQSSAMRVEAEVAPGGPVTVADVKQRFEARFPGIEIAAVRPTPFPGLFEVQIGKDLLYSDSGVSYVMQGSLVDATTRVDLTSKRLVELTQVPFDQLPLDKAIKQVKGNGQRVLVAFEDPNCGYCKRLHETLEEVDNVTVYTLLYPILSPDSHEKARNIWCAPDRVAAWRAWMLEGVVPPEAKCETPIDDIAGLGRQMTIRGTPALFFVDGSRVNGAMPLAALVEKLDGVHQALAKK